MEKRKTVKRRPGASRAASGPSERPGRREQRRERTRRRIVEATVELHSTIGPMRTSYSAIAQRAGVSRPTLYAYFPTERELFAACTAHTFSVDPPPDPGSWAAIADPAERLATALSALYAHYRRNARRMSNILRDAAAMGMPAFEGRTMESDRALTIDRLAVGWSVSHDARQRVRAALEHATAFSTWQTLTQPYDLADVEAVHLMVGLVVAAAKT